MKLRYLLLVFLFNIIIIKESAAQINPPTVPGKFNHIAFYVADLKIATDFYKDIFHLEEIYNPLNDGRHAWFSLGPGSALHIIAGAKSRSNYFIEEHFCFSVPSIENTIKKLKANNIVFTNFKQVAGEVTLRPDGVHQIYFQDPDGHWLEVNDAKK